MHPISFVRMLKNLKFVAILIASAVLFFAGIHFINYQETPNAAYVSVLSLISHPFGYVVAATAIGLAFFAVWKRNEE
jgi:hypothetical protein